MKRDLVSIVEAGYRLGLDDNQWLIEVALSLAPILDAGRGLVAWYYDASRRGQLATHGFIGLPSDGREPRRGRAAQCYPGIPISFASDVFGAARWCDRACTELHRVYETGVRDVHVFNAADPTGFGCIVAASVPDGRHGLRGAVHLWARLAAHIAAGLRLRRRFSTPTGSRPAGEALIAPGGRVAHAEGPARQPGALVALRRAARAAVRARGPMRKSAPEQAVGLWQGLVHGRWTLLDQFERDGRRYLVAHRNDPQIVTPRALTLRERQVLAYAALGHSTKLIAYELGLSVGATSAYLAAGMRKLGLRSRVQLVGLGARLTGAPPTAAESS
jgi:DNA-binding CsgD family transcriptional regulator